MNAKQIKAAIIAQYWSESTTAEDSLGVVAWDGEAVGRRPETKKVFLFLVPVSLAPEFCADCCTVQKMSPASLPAGKSVGWHLRLKPQAMKDWMRAHSIPKVPLNMSVSAFEEEGAKWVESLKAAGHGDANLGWYAEKCVASLVGMRDYTPLHRNWRAEAEADIEASGDWAPAPHALIEIKVCVGTHLGQIGALFE